MPPSRNAIQSFLLPFRRRERRRAIYCIGICCIKSIPPLLPAKERTIKAVDNTTVKYGVGPLSTLCVWEPLLEIHVEEKEWVWWDLVGSVLTLNGISKNLTPLGVASTLAVARAVACLSSPQHDMWKHAHVTQQCILVCTMPHAAVKHYSSGGNKGNFALIIIYFCLLAPKLGVSPPWGKPYLVQWIKASPQLELR